MAVFSMSKNKKDIFHRFSTKWWELVIYLLIILIAIVFNDLHFPKWVLVPLVLAILLVRFVRIHFF